MACFRGRFGYTLSQYANKSSATRKRREEGKRGEWRGGSLDMRYILRKLRNLILRNLNTHILDGKRIHRDRLILIKQQRIKHNSPPPMPFLQQEEKPIIRFIIDIDFSASAFNIERKPTRDRNLHLPYRPSSPLLLLLPMHLLQDLGAEFHIVARHTMQDIQESDSTSIPTLSGLVNFVSLVWSPWTSSLP